MKCIIFHNFHKKNNERKVIKPPPNKNALISFHINKISLKSSYFLNLKSTYNNKRIHKYHIKIHKKFVDATCKIKQLLALKGPACVID